MIDATFFDGRSTRPTPVRVGIQGGQMVVAEPGQSPRLRQPLERILVQPALKNAPQLIDLGDGATLQVSDKAALADMLRAAGIRPGPVELAERSWAAFALALLAIAGFVWSAYLWVLPWAAERVAGWVPPAIEQQVGDQLWPALERQMFQASQLPATRQQALRERLASVVGAGGPVVPYRLEFRGAPTVGPNALALPGGRIVVTDELVELASNDDALIGVLAHEVGHVDRRHSLRTLVQGVAVGSVISRWLGDVSTVVASVSTTLATLRYSRDFEREADDYAIDRLGRAGLSTGPLADLLEQLSARSGADENTLWASHPVTAERVERLRKAPG